MKAHFCLTRTRSTDGRGNPRNARVYRAVILLVLLACGGATAIAQTNNPPVSPASPGGGNSTNTVGISTNAVGNSTNVVKLAPTTVVGKLDVARNQIVPDLGATVYTMNEAQIAALPQGENAPFNTVLLATPGMAQDSAVNGDLHLRGEHANIQYRINDVLLPEGITGFGEELDTRFVDSLRLITGSLPAQYGFRTAGVVDLTTKSGAFAPGGEASVYGGSYDTIKPSFEVGGSKGNLNYFVDGSYDHNSLGIENPTSSATAIHDDTDQFKTFAYLSYIMDDTSRISVMGSASYADFQVPNTPGLPAGTNSNGIFWNQVGFGLPATFNSSDLNENQNEQNYYAVAAYQKSLEDFNLQVAGFGRVSTVHFTPDPVGDLYFNGVGSDVDRKLYSGGLQADASYKLGESHTLRGGLMVLDEYLTADTTTTVFNLDANGNPTGLAYPIVDNTAAHALFIGVYLQDEWKVLPKVTLNYGARFDLYYASFDKENQPSPRVNLIYQPTDATTLHAGYARYFTPPPLENVPSTSVAKFDGTSNASGTDLDDHARAERANYFDAGISQKLAPGLQVGVDGYYKNSVQQLDDGLFGQTLILQAFNYAEGRIYGVEFTTSYTTGGFSTYANLAYSVAQGQNWDSAQFLFDPGDAQYVQNHWIYLDHDQRVTGSFGASYLWKEEFGATRVYVNALYGTGLRQDGGGTEDGTPTGAPIPNGASVPSYYSVSLGAEQSLKVGHKSQLKARLDVVNITDDVYELRSGTGVGVNAAQYGMRLGFFGTLSYVF
jgi:outer membrane receptor protein involved in Fe transport